MHPTTITFSGFKGFEVCGKGMNGLKVLAVLIFLILRPALGLVENDTFSTALVTLTGDNFDKTLEKNSLMVMFYYAG